MPSDTNISDLRSGLIKSNILVYGNKSYHIACIFEGKASNIKNISYGINIYDNNRGIGMTHAEVNAINNLPSRQNNSKHLKKINILVIRTSHTGKLGMSKPCIKCIIDMNNIAPKRGYIVKNISYSDSDGNINTISLKKLIEEGNFHVSQFYKMHNFQHALLKLNIS
jgi:pyrimidine deaminase RibD-like protein